MDAEWIKSPTARRVLEHWADPRPAWLWSGDGARLLWRNTAARQFHSKGKKRGPRFMPEAAPIRGQISRLIRLGSLNRSSLSRIQFLAGDRPVSATCACMPLQMPDDNLALLIVDVDPVSSDFLEAPFSYDTASEALFPPGTDYVVIDDDGQIAGGSPRALERYVPFIESEGLPEPGGAGGDGEVVIDGVPLVMTRFRASPRDASLLLLEPVTAPADAGSVKEAALKPSVPIGEDVAEPLLPMGLPPVPPAPAANDGGADHWGALPGEQEAGGGLTSLFDRLADDTDLYAPLRDDEDYAFGQAAAANTQTPVAEMRPAPEAAEAVSNGRPQPTEPQPETSEPEAFPSHDAAPAPPMPNVGYDSDAVAALIVAPEETQAAAPGPVVSCEPAVEPAKPVLFKVIGRGFTAIARVESAAETVEPATAIGAETAPAEAAMLPEPQAAAAEPAPLSETPAAAEPALDRPAAPEAASDAESVERVSRYNFDELSRILNDRVGGDNNAPEPGYAVTDIVRRPGATLPTPAVEGALVTLGGETLVLNRLPLGILVFRDQQVLFANRSITEMIGYETVESLRAAGLAAIFPSAGGEPQGAGPVNHLVQRDGTLVPVTARLQSISWQGRPALMLSASATEVRTGHEAAVRAFAELLAETRDDGFIEAARSGVITLLSARAALALGRSEDQLVGRPLSLIVAQPAAAGLKAFLERPARFAETARPTITLKGNDPSLEILLFAQGQAGIVTGYFGFVRRREADALTALPSPAVDADPALLARLSRGVRRPLNTVIGFSDLIGSAAFGAIENQRYLEYARDIKTAGQEIAALVDELDDYARLRDGRYLALPTDIELGPLLESCVIRVRGQANAARVLVRSAISEKLPRVRADRASLGQAVLNLLASAIAQTPQDGSVVLSAQIDDEGGVAVHVRDSAQSNADLGERFVVFRDGIGRDGEVLGPVRSSVGLALTRSLLAVNACSLSVDPAGGVGTLFSLIIPPENVVQV